MDSGTHGFHVPAWLPLVPSYLTPKFYTCQLFESLRVLPLPPPSHPLGLSSRHSFSTTDLAIALVWGSKNLARHGSPPRHCSEHLASVGYCCICCQIILQKQSILIWPLTRSRTWSPVSLKSWEPIPSLYSLRSSLSGMERGTWEDQ